MIVKVPPRERPGSRMRSRMLFGVMIILLSLVAEFVIPPHANAGTINLTVGPNTNAPIALAPDAIGVNAPGYNSQFVSQGTNAVSKLQNVAITSLRFPGGSNADTFDWRDLPAPEANSSFAVPASYLPFHDYQPYEAPNETFDAFMHYAIAAGDKADITVDYGAGTPQLAAQWVQYANGGFTGPNGVLAYHTAQGIVPSYANNGLTNNNLTEPSQEGNQYNIPYWEVGNEVYGDGYYPNASWEYNARKDTSPTGYAQNLLLYSQAMKAQASNIQIGAVVTMPGDYPDDDTLAAKGITLQPWDATVLGYKNPSNAAQTVCSAINFVSVHWYPQQPTSPTSANNTIVNNTGNVSDARLLAAPENGSTTSGDGSLANKISILRNRITAACGATVGANIAIRVTEVNSVAYSPQKQSVGLVNGLFLDDAYLNFLEAGVQSVDWWALYAGFYQNPTDEIPGTAYYSNFFLPQEVDPANNPNLYPTGVAGPLYGDYGLLTDGSAYTSASGTVAEPAANTPTPSYYGMQMLAELFGIDGILEPLTFGKLVTANYSTGKGTIPLLKAHYMWDPGIGFTAVMLINDDPTNTYNVTLNRPGTVGWGSKTMQWTYGPTNAASQTGPTVSTITSSEGDPPPPVNVVVAPYTVTVLNFQSF